MNQVRQQQQAKTQPQPDYRPVPPEDEEIIRQVQADHPGYSRELILRQIDAA